MHQLIDELLVAERIRELRASARKPLPQPERRQREEDGPANRLPSGDLWPLRMMLWVRGFR
jgi:hypothetical protein